MATWYFLSLGDGMTSGVLSAEIEDAFASAFTAAGEPPAMAVFTRPESEGRLHCEVIAYFSPAAGSIANLFDAEPCEQPAQPGLGLLAGESSCWSVLFAEIK